VAALVPSVDATRDPVELWADGLQLERAPEELLKLLLEAAVQIGKGTVA